jgi:hypothetical protein
MVDNDLKLAQAGYMCGKLGKSVPVSQGLPTNLGQRHESGRWPWLVAIAHKIMDMALPWSRWP